MARSKLGVVISTPSDYNDLLQLSITTIYYSERLSVLNQIID